MFQSIIVYSCLMGIMILCAVFAARKERLQMASLNSTKLRRPSYWGVETLLPLVLFAVVFGMRFDVGTDYLNYLQGYLNNHYVGKNELLFDSLSIIGWNLNLHYAVYFGFIALIQVYFFFYAFKGERYLFPFLVFFLFTNGEWLSWMNILRQSLALCIWIFSLKFIDENKLLKYLLCCAIAFFFHTSAGILFIFYPILRSGKDYFKSISFQLILLASSFVAKELFSDIMSRLEPIIESYASIIGDGVYSGYGMTRLENSFIESDGTGIAYMFRILLNVIVILYSVKLKSFYNSRRFNIIYFFFIVSLITFYMFPVGLVSITRPFRYFYIFQSITYAYFLYYLYNIRFKNNSYGRLNALLYYGTIIAFLGIFYLSLISSNQDGHMWYQFYFDQSIYGYPK